MHNDISYFSNMKQLLDFIIKRAIRYTREDCVFQREGGIERATETKKLCGGEEIWVPDVITTCLLFVRMVLCKSCNIRIIRGMHAASRSVGG